MKSVNRVTLLGNIGKDPELKFTGSGSAIANFSIATTERFKDAAGAWKDRTEWASLVAFGRLAEIVRDYVKKGSKLYVEGKLSTRSWEDKTTGKQVYRTEVKVDELVLLSAKQGERTLSPEPDSPPQGDIDDSDIPF